MTVNVDVPDDAELGNYTGHLNIKIVPRKKGGSGVAIALGARVDIDLNLTDETIPEFKVWSAEMPDIETLKAPWNWKIFSWFFYRVRVVLEVQNIGNIDTSPSKVHIDIYDAGRNMIIEKADDINIRKIPPYKTEKVTASFPTKLPDGQYQAKIKVYKENQVMNNYEITFTINKPGEGGKGISEFGIWPWVLFSTYVIFVLIIILILVKLRFWKFVFKLLYIVSWPIRWFLRFVLSLITKLKLKFWSWMHNKSKQYQPERPEDTQGKTIRRQNKKIKNDDETN